MATKTMQQNWSSEDPSASTLGTDAASGTANTTDVGAERVHQNGQIASGHCIHFHQNGF